MDQIYNVPATCELCGNWIPEHLDTCPRNGVHPSQWKYDDIHTEDDEIENEHYMHQMIDLQL
ncbi:hypothetical protein BDB01DRAFT_794185 [Pilobolus umbonatus]|nr:hypothetical protein BDB01DRAFT_794185 [Pilobolus umbonatus]